MYILVAKGQKTYIVSAEKKDSLFGIEYYVEVFYKKPKFEDLIEVYKEGYRNFDIHVYTL